MPEHTSTEDLELQEIEDYLNVAFANGFSKGTANVSPADMKKLSPLLKHYGKMAHPFRQCVKDNRKRFGSLTEKYCAVLKDLIKGTTSWRSTERKKHLSEQALDIATRIRNGETVTLSDDLNEFYLHWEDYPDNYIDEFLESLSELTEEDVKLLLSDNNSNNVEDEEMTEVVDLASGEVAWMPDGSWNSLKKQVETALNDHTQYGQDYWVEDMNGSEALVCEKGTDYYVVGYSVDKKSHEVSLEDEKEWRLVEKAWVESNMNFSDDNKELLAELFFTEAGTDKADSDGYVWKTFLREGTWEYSPGNGGKVPRPLTINKSGKSDQKKLIISMAELKKNFDAGAIQHVTVPLSHEDKVTENTGFVKKLRYGKDKDGKTTLEAAIDFTEPDIKEKIDRGTIPNVSGGIHFNHIDKESGKKFNIILGHIALTPKPWLQGMAPFGVNASENLNVVGFSEVPDPSEEPTGGEDNTMTTIETENADTFLSELGLSEDEVKARLARYDELEQESKGNKIAEKVRGWEEAKKAPAVITVAKAALLADDGDTEINLSDNGKSETVSLSEIVDRLVEASPQVALADDPITDAALEGEAPPDDATEENLSSEVKSEANRLFLYENYSEADAIAEAKRKFAEETTA